MALFAVGLGVAQAQVARSGGTETARLAQQLQQATAERLELQSENVRLKQELSTLQQKAGTSASADDALRRRAQSAEAAAGRLAAENASATERLTRVQAQLDQLVARFRETAQALRELETERHTLQVASEASTRDLSRCRDANAELIRINGEVLDRLENVGFWTKLAAAEPFTQLKRTELRNLADEYRGRAGDLAQPPAPAQPGQANPSAAVEAGN
jgi:chromosome segregation ATPase